MASCFNTFCSRPEEAPDDFSSIRKACAYAGFIDSNVSNIVAIDVSKFAIDFCISWIFSSAKKFKDA